MRNLCTYYKFLIVQIKFESQKYRSLQYNTLKNTINKPSNV